MPSKVRKQRRSGPKHRTGLVLVAAVASAVVLLLVLVTRAQVPGGKAEDFPIDVYRGQAALGGQAISLHGVLGQGKPVVLNFWAGLCPPCRAEMPGFQRIHEAYGDRFTMLGVDVGPYVGLGSRQDALRFLEEFSITYPTGRALSSQPVRDYNVRSMPTTVFFTPDGEVFSTHIGFLDEQDARRELLKLFAASGIAAAQGVKLAASHGVRDPGTQPRGEVVAEPTESMPG